jgi:signal transduction histidine kinase
MAKDHNKDNASSTINMEVAIVCCVIGLLVLAACTWFLFSHPSKIAPAPRAGYVDLSKWDFAHDGAVRLNGVWLYHDRQWSADANATPGVRTAVPGPWHAAQRGPWDDSYGFGTYTLTVKLPAAQRGDSFGIDTGRPLSAYRLYANGKLIAQNGMPSATAKYERADPYSTLGAIDPSASTVRLSLEISNHVANYGGIAFAPSVGLMGDLQSARYRVQTISDIIFGILLFAAFYHLALSRFGQGGPAHLCFALLAALTGFRNLLLEPHAHDVVSLIGQIWVWRLQYATTALMVVTVYWFLALSFRRYLSRIYGLLLTAVCLGVAAISLVSNVTVGEFGLKCVETVDCISIVYLTQAIARAAWAGEKGAKLAFLGWLIVAAAIVHDILIDNAVIAGADAIPFGCVAFFLCLSGAMTARSQADLDKAERLSAQLANLNARLETDVAERTSELKQKVLELEQQKIELEHSRAAAVSANETKSRFLANMSHELRTPMNAILGFSEVIHKRLFGDDTERYSQYAADIHTSGSRLLSLINDILDLSKIEAGKLQLTDTPLRLSDAIRDAMRLLEARAAEKTVRLHYDAGMPFVLLADERAIHQILVNLLTNAVKFTRPGGNVSVVARCESDGTLCLAVVDDGVGIKAEDIDHVMESFGQSRHDVVTDSERGTGLGLPIVKGLVAAHGGTFRLESTFGAGTIAIAIFPAYRVLGAQQGAARASGG